MSGTYCWSLSRDCVVVARYVITRNGEVVANMMVHTGIHGLRLISHGMASIELSNRRFSVAIKLASLSSLDGFDIAF
jgi:hypothetical protein